MVHSYFSLNIIFQIPPLRRYLSSMMNDIMHYHSAGRLLSPRWNAVKIYLKHSFHRVSTLYRKPFIHADRCDGRWRKRSMVGGRHVEEACHVEQNAATTSPSRHEFPRISCGTSSNSIESSSLISRHFMILIPTYELSPAYVFHLPRKPSLPPPPPKSFCLLSQLACRFCTHTRPHTYNQTITTIDITITNNRNRQSNEFNP